MAHVEAMSPVRLIAPMTSAEFWRGRRVFMTGHTGFIGGWLALALWTRGAHVVGYALPPMTRPSLFEAIGLRDLVETEFADVRDAAALRRSLEECSPSVVFHLAAQPLVREAHSHPLTTFQTNVMGTANLLDAVRSVRDVQAAVVMTTDKVYANHEWAWPYREADALGGHEPYGASKAAAEMAVAAWNGAYFANGGPAVVTVRAGNVIGGGDWSSDRVVPDAIRAFAAGEPLILRNPEAVRPWQHVMEPVGGLIRLAEHLVRHGATAAPAYNFGPPSDAVVAVRDLADHLAAAWGGNARWAHQPSGHPARESNLLALDSSLARTDLGWRPAWSLATTINKTAEWYRQHEAGAAMRTMTLQQMETYEDESHGRNRSSDETDSRIRHIA
ncbi:MAG: CDP-glucose 4,6-dehydratase [Alphaproteobacteria bacterium]